MNLWFGILSSSLRQGNFAGSYLIIREDGAIIKAGTLKTREEIVVVVVVCLFVCFFFFKLC